MIDRSSLAKMTAGDEELLADVAILFVRLLPDLKARIRMGIENREHAEVENAAHQLRSRVSYFGATDLKSIASQLESAARHDETETIERLGQQMLDGVDQLLVELRSITRLALEMDDE